jgi:hypothetical protein
MTRRITFAALALLAPLVARAATLNEFGANCPPGSIGCDLANGGLDVPGFVKALTDIIINSITGTGSGGFGLAEGVAIIALIFAANNLIFSRGASEKTEAAKKAIMWIIIGYILVKIGQLVIEFITTTLVTIGQQGAPPS